MFKKVTKKIAKLRHKKRLPLGAVIVLTAAISLLVFIGLNATLGYVSHRTTEKDDYNLPLTITNVTYCNGEKLDLFVPQSKQPVPLVIYIHGGGWRYGSKVGGLFPDVKTLTSKGYAVASVNYRLSARAKFPAQIQDIFCAVRFLRSQARIYNLDREKFGLIGISAGGHLAALAATASDQPMYTSGDYQEQSSKIQAAVILSGLLDLTDKAFSTATKQNIKELLGPGETALSSSPTSYLSADDPPMFALYASHDTQVPTHQTRNFITAAQSLGVTAGSLEVKSATHNFDPYFALGTRPSKGEWLESVAQFFAKNLP